MFYPEKHFMCVKVPISDASAELAFPWAARFTMPESTSHTLTNIEAAHLGQTN